MSPPLRRRLRALVALFALIASALLAASAWAWHATRPVWHTDEIHVLAFSPDGDWLLSGGSKGTLKLWRTSDLERGWGRGFATLCPATNDIGSGSRITHIAFTDARHALVARLRGSLEVWDLETCTLARVLRAEGLRVSALAVSPDGRSAICGDEWNRPSERSFWGQTRGVLDGLESAGAFTTRDIATGELIGLALEGHRLAAGVDLRVFDTLSGEVRFRFSSPSYEALKELVEANGGVSPYGKYTLAASASTEVEAWEATDELTAWLRKPARRHLQFDRDRCVYALEPGSGTVRAFALQDLREIGQTTIRVPRSDPAEPQETVWAVAPGGTHFAVATPDGKILLTTKP